MFLVGHARFPVSLKAGPQRVLLPVLERESIVGSLIVVCDKEMPIDTPLSIRVLCDRTEGSGRPIELREETSGRWVASPPDLTIGRDDCLDLSWSGAPRRVKVHLAGKDREGTAVEKDLELGKTQSNVARIACGEFMEGELTTVEILAPGASELTGILGRVQLDPRK